MWVHRLIEKDENTKLGVCSNCGPVSLILQGKTLHCREAVRARIKKYRADGRDVNWNNRHRKRVQTNGMCTICKQEGPLVRDHDHITGLSRGLICNFCNLGLGFFRDKKESLSQAIIYLDSS